MMDITTICGMHNRIIGMDMSGIRLILGNQLESITQILVLQHLLVIFDILILII